MTADVRHVAADDPRLEGLDAFARAHATGEPPPPFAPSLDTDRIGAEQRARDEARAKALGPRKPHRATGGPPADPLAFPPRPSWELVGTASLTAVCNNLRGVLNRHAAGWSKSRRKRLEAAVAELEAAIAGTKS